MNFFRHLRTVMRHRKAVRKLCFKCGLYRQGLFHDLSKYSRAEFHNGVKYYQGYRSPHARERELFGYSSAWLHHKGRNKHHFEYWTDFADGHKVYVEMPAKYLAEMICDRVGATKVYLKDKYTDGAPLDYFLNKTDRGGMNPKTAERTEYFLTMLKEKGEDYTFKELKKFVKENKAARK